MDKRLMALDAADEQLAGTAAKLLQAILAAARQRAEDDETRAILDGLREARLVVQVQGPKIILELRAPSERGELRVYRVEAAEIAAMLQ